MESGSEFPTTTNEIDDLDFSAPARSNVACTDAADHIQQQDPGDASGEAIPVPIPNTEVKLSSAEDTERAAFRENRSSPGSCAFRRRCAPVARNKTGRGVPTPLSLPLD